jgi:NADH-quinone oxidoreductase subunit E
MVGVGYLDLAGCMALGITGPVLRSAGLPHDLRKAAPYCGYETYDFDVVTRDTADAYGRLRVRIDEMYQSLRIIEQACRRLEASAGDPVMVADKKIAWPAQLAIGSDGMGNSLDHIKEIMGTSMESSSTTSSWSPRASGCRPARPMSRSSRQGRARLPPRLRRRHPALPGALPRPELQQPAGRRPCAKAARSPTSSSRWPRSTPSWEVWTADEHYGTTASGFLHVSAESKAPYAADVWPPCAEDAAAVVGALPGQALGAAAAAAPGAERRRLRHRPRHRVLRRDARPDQAEVSGVATFYTQYKRHPNGDYTVGVCTNTLCAIMGGDQIWDAVSEHLGVGHDETTTDGKITLERVECNAACDYAPVVMVNWEFYDNQTPESTIAPGRRPARGPGRPPTRGADNRSMHLQGGPGCSPASPTAAPTRASAPDPSLIGLEVAHEHDWRAPRPQSAGELPPPSTRPSRSRTATIKTEVAAESAGGRHEGRGVTDDADPDPDEVLGPPAESWTLATYEANEGYQALTQGAGMDRPSSCRGQGLRPAWPWWRRLPDRHEVVVHAPTGRRPALPRGQRRRVRAGHLQGHPADDGQPPLPHRGRGDHAIRHRVQPRLHLPARRGRPRLPAPAARGRGGVRRGPPRQEHPRLRLRPRRHGARRCRRLHLW